MSCGPILLFPQPVAGFKHPGEDTERYHCEDRNHDHARCKADVTVLVKTPAKSTDEIKNGIKQRNLMPEWRKHIDRIETPSKECQRCNDEEGN